jgi:putative hydrolase of the HAD superfamily
VVRAVLFDAAGTLIRLREPVGETYARFALAHGVRVPASRLDEAFGRVFRAASPMVFPGATPERAAELERGWWRDQVRATFRAADGMASFTDFAACFAALWDHFATAHAWEAAPGAHATLRALRRRGLRTGVVSNFDQRLRGLLQATDLAALLDDVVLPAEAGAAKPDPRIFAFALARLGVAPEHAAYVGDDAEHDIAGAAGAGLRAIGVGALATLEDLVSEIERT